MPGYRQLQEDAAHVGVPREFGEHRFDRDVEGERLAAADEKFFAELAKGVVSNQAKVDQGIVKRLASGWRLERLDATARAVLRAAKTAYRCVRDMSYEDAGDYLMAKNDQARLFDPEQGREQGMKQFLDDKSYRPGLQGYRREG